MRILTLFLFQFLLFLSFAQKSNNPSDLLWSITKGEYKLDKPLVKQMQDPALYAHLTSDRRAIVASNYITQQVVDTILDLEKFKDQLDIKYVDDFVFDRDENRVMINTAKKRIFRHSFTTTYYVYHRYNKDLFPISQETKEQQYAQFSPSGRYVAFVSNNNLHLAKIDFKTESAITKDGSVNGITYGATSWMYEEEFGVTNLISFSEDNKLLAFSRIDETETEKYTYPKYSDDFPTYSTVAYSRAGRHIGKTTILVFDIDNRTTKEMKFDEKEEFCYYSNIKFSNEPDELYAVRLDRAQTTMELFSVNARTRLPRLLIRQQDSFCQDFTGFNSLMFLPKGQFIVLSETDGYRHAYLYNQNGTVLRQLTKGNWNVLNVIGYNVDKGHLYYISNEGGVESSAFYRVDAKGKTITLSKDPKGWNDILLLNSNYTTFISEYSNITTPTRYEVCNDKGVVKAFGSNDLQAAVSSLQTKEMIKHNLPNGTSLNGWILKPANFDPNKEYKLIVTQYSGPGSQDVRNRWNIGWEYYLASSDYLVMGIDPRGTAGQSREFRNLTHNRIGVLETEDIIAAVREFSKNSFVDANNIGIWGWSYGGYVSLMALTTKNNPFKGGIAIAPVTNWDYYTAAYTERFMGRPQENYSGYEMTNILERAKDLDGKLLLIHGTTDENVHIENTYMLARRFVELGIQFDMHIYPNENHGIYGAKNRHHIFTKCKEYFDNIFTNFINN